MPYRKFVPRPAFGGVTVTFGQARTFEKTASQEEILDWVRGDHPKSNPIFFNRYGFRNDTGFDALNPVFLPRLGFTYKLPEGGIVRRAERLRMFGGCRRVWRWAPRLCSPGPV